MAFRGSPSLGRAKRTWLALLRLPEASPGAAADGGELLQEAELEGVQEAVTSLVWQEQNVVFGTATGFHVYSVGRHPLLLWRPVLLRRISCRCGITRCCYFTRGTLRYFTRGTLRLLRLATWSRPT